MRAVLLLLSLLYSASASEVFLKEPAAEPYFIREGGPGVTLPCVIKPEFFNKDKYEINWARYNNGQLRMITKNDKLLVKKHSRFILENNESTGNYSLIITEIDKNTVEGTYHCNVIATDDSDVQYSALANLVVLVPPGDPIISTTPLESVIEGDFVTAKCVSVGGSPQPVFTWTLPNETIASDAIFTTQFRDGATESLLHFRVTAADNDKSVQCEVTNKAMETGDTKSVRSTSLNVLYKPIVFITPTENLTHLSVEEGELVNLTCNAASNPPAHSYEWKHLASGERYQGKVWPIRVDTTLNGDFECRSTNELGEGSALLKLIVQHTPRISVPTSLSPNEQEDIDIECRVNAVPEAIDIRWVGPNGFKMNGSRLILSSVTKSQTGNYTCMATNFLTVYGQSGSQQRIGTGVTMIDVKRKPGNALIMSVKQSVDVGETIKLKCVAEDVGNPSASYMWSSPSSGGIFGLDGHNEETFIVRNAQLSDNGDYSCKAFNDLGEGKPATIRVTVIEKARISSPLTTERIFTSGEQGKQLECEAQGYPTPVVSWLKDGQLVKQTVYPTSFVSESKCNPEDFCTQTVTSTLTLPGPLKWSDKGNFTCVADNGSVRKDKDDSSWTIVRVLHKPVVLNRKFNDRALAASDIGSQAILKCRVSARPEPEFHWIYKGAEILEDENHSVHTHNGKKPDEYEQVLQIENVQDGDYGEYVCRATNGNGGDSVIIELKKTSTPGLPDDLKKVSATSNSILISWIPQFDGGNRQSFVVEARKIDPFSGEIDKSVPAAKVTVKDAVYHEEHETDGTMKVKNTYNLTGLTPLSSYYLRIQSANEKGESEFTPMLIASTDDVREDPNMMSPSRLIYDSSEAKIDVEPKLPVDACTLLYVLVDGIWRSTQCHTSSNPISDIISGREYKARFCTMENSLQCSPSSKPINIGSGSVWKTNALIPFVFFVFIGLSVCVFFLVCCKTRSNTKTSKLAPIILSPLPNDEAKKAADYEEPRNSVFTMNSNRFKSDTVHLSNHDSLQPASENTTLEYDVSNDCYLQDNSDVLKNTQLPGFNINTNVNVVDEIGENEEDRRVVREIIV